MRTDNEQKLFLIPRRILILELIKSIIAFFLKDIFNEILVVTYHHFALLTVGEQLI